MVAAWISAEIGVGPSIESGSHTCSGTWADLPMAPMNRQMQMMVAVAQMTGASVIWRELPNRLIEPDHTWMCEYWLLTSMSEALANTVA